MEQTKPLFELNQSSDRVGVMAFENVYNKDGFYITANLFGVLAQQNGRNGVCFIARNPCEIMWVAETHQVAAGDLNTVTLNLEVTDSGEAADAGDEVLKVPYDLKGTVNTVLQKQGYQDLQNRQMSPGQKLSWVISGMQTCLLGVQITIYLKTLGKGDYR